MLKEVRFKDGDWLPDIEEASYLIKEWYETGGAEAYVYDLFSREAVLHFREGDYGRALEVFIPEHFIHDAYEYNSREEVCFECLYYMMADILENVWEFPCDVTIWGGEQLAWLVMELEGLGVFTINSLNEMIK